MEKFHLSKRLRAIAAFNGDGRRIADIGTDHAYLPIELAKQGQIDFAVASDIGAGPCAIARANVADNDLAEVITVRQADGLLGLTAEDVLDTVYIAGMGGILIQQILAQGADRLDGTETLVLSPNRDAESLRRWLAAHEFGILDEALVEDMGHVYPIMVVGQTKPQVPYTEADLMLGPVLRRQRTPLFVTQLTEAITKTQAVLANLTNAKTLQTAKIAEEQARLHVLEEEAHDDH